MLTENSVIIPTNEYQTPITKELLDRYPAEVHEQFLEFVDTVPLIKYMIGTDRKRAKDLPKDSKGRIIVDITHPHILENMDYFRPAGLFYKENGCYTLLKENSNPNSEYGKWLKEEFRRCRDGYVRESDGEWVTGYMYWFLNYNPIMLNRLDEDSGIYIRQEDFPDFWEGIYYRFHYLDQARHAGKHGMELARRGASKAHPYSEKVITPEGEKLWGDITVGDYLFGDDGKPTKVVDIPFDGDCDTYRITLRDGRSVLASDEHLWKVKVHRHKDMEIYSTKELYNIYARKRKVTDRNPNGVEYICGIPVNGAVEFGARDILIDPYTLGVMLGDGCFTTGSCYLSENSKDFSVISKHIPYSYIKWSNYCSYRLDIPNWRKSLEAYGLADMKSADKFIPDDYKYNTESVRRAVLTGIMDTDGFLGKHSVYMITTTSKRLASDIRFICWSLGYNTTMTEQKAGYKKNGEYVRCHNAFVVSIHTDDRLTHLPRKTRKNYTSNYAKNRAVQSRIVNIEYVGKMKSKCVTVDNKSHCYLINDFVITHNSFSLASIMSHNLILGENAVAKSRVTTILTASTKEYLSDKDGTFTKFTPMIDFVFAHTEFPKLFLKRSPSEMIWRMGYKNSNGNELGSLNAVMGLSTKDDEGKIRGKRGYILFEEMGNFPNFKEVWNNVRDSVKEGSHVFSLMFAVGTAGDDASDFSGVQTILYHPSSFEVYALENVYDRVGKGTKQFSYFFPSYISRAGCMDKDGNSDVVKALLEILMERWTVKQSGDAASLLSRTAQMPVTPAEAILKVKSNFFPVTMLTERLRQIDQDPHFYDDVYVGTLIEVNGNVEFRATDDVPLRQWKVDNSNQGALEIYEMPPAVIPLGRYVIGHDPVDNDQAESTSFSSTIVFDLFTDKIVAEYTGRLPFADDNFEMLRLLGLFYKATIMVEANKKGYYSYFAKKHCTWMLADCPEYLRDRQLVKYSMFGSAQKGITVNAAIISFANGLIKDWLLKTYTAEFKDENGEVTVQSVPNVYRLRNRALIEELIGYAPEVNTDRVRALDQVMLCREQYLILYGGSPEADGVDNQTPAEDDFFDRDWKRKQDRLTNRRLL